MGTLVAQALDFIIGHLLILFVFVPIGIIFLGYLLYIIVNVVRELRKNKKG